jgi:parallel beta-helix repeat protein
MTASSRTLLIGVVVAGLGAGAADAATRCVNPRGAAGCFTTIAAAVSDAGTAAGDTILVAAGVYNESVTIPKGKDGLRLVGTGAVVDPEIRPYASAGAALAVHASGVSIINMTFRNGRDVAIAADASGLSLTGDAFLGTANGVRLLPGADGARIHSCRFQGMTGSAISFGDPTPIKVNDLSVTATVFNQIGENALAGYGDDLNVAGNVISNVYDYAIFLGVGDRPVVTRNTFRDIYYPAASLGANQPAASPVFTYNRATNLTYGKLGCVEIVGDGAQVASNTINGCDALALIPTSTGSAFYAGVYVSGTGALVTRNVINTSAATGILVDTGSHDGVVSYNRVSAGTVNLNQFHAIDVTADRAQVLHNTVSGGCDGVFVDGNNPTVSNNVVSNTGCAGIEIYLEGGSGGTVSHNTVSDIAHDAGFVLNGMSGADGVAVTANSATRVDSIGFVVIGDAVSVISNQSVDAGADGFSGGYGFLLTGTSMTVASNLARNAGGDGFRLEGAGPFAVTANLADHCTEDGFDVHGMGVTLANNRALSNAGVGFEVDAAALATQFTGGNAAVGNAITACIGNSGAAATISGVNALGTPDTPVACDEPSGYVGN